MSSCSTDEKVAPVGGCGCGQPVAFDGATPDYRRALYAVIVLNVAGLIVVGIGGWFAGSASLAANSLDFAADAATYALSLWAIGKSIQVRSGAAVFKAASLVVVALIVVALAVWRAIAGVAPEGPAISGLGLFGAAVNLAAALLLVRYRDGDANVRSVWLCTRNDLIECIAVAIAGAAVWLTGSRWPDLLMGAFLAAVFLRSAWQINTQARQELRSAHEAAT